MIGLLGTKGSGKTLAATEIQSLGFERMSFASPLKTLIHNATKMDDSCKLSLSEHTDEYLLNLEVVNGFLQKHSLPKLTHEEVTTIHTNWKTLNVKDAYRFMMQYIGTDVARSRDPDIWANTLFRSIKELKKNHKKIVIDDLRFVNEAAKIMQHKPSILIKVVRPIISSQDCHLSETEHNHINCDFMIINDGSVEHLREQLKGFIARYHRIFA